MDIFVIHQTYSLIEIIVVNDCPDETKLIRSIVKKYSKVRFYSNLKNLGPSRTRNYGVQTGATSTTQSLLRGRRAGMTEAAKRLDGGQRRARSLATSQWRAAGPCPCGFY